MLQEPNISALPWTSFFRVFIQYAIAQILFGDTVFHKMMVEVLCDEDKRLARKAPSKHVNEQLAYSEDGIKIRAFWFGRNCPPGAGDDRYLDWVPKLEAIVPD